MQNNWNDDQPIYKQLKNKMAGLILRGAFNEGEAIPSVRQVASEYQINHITVSKAYQELVDDGVVEKRRGLGMFVVEGAQQKLLEQERNKFLHEEIPNLMQRVEQLGISSKELINIIKAKNKGNQ
jgi:DNA-binding transcriptional regulator YhcF (GntR family)